MTTPPQIFAASSVSFEPQLPAGLPHLALEGANANAGHFGHTHSKNPATRPANHAHHNHHVEHPHHFTTLPGLHNHALTGGHAPQHSLTGSSPPRNNTNTTWNNNGPAPAHAHHPALVSHTHVALTQHLKDRSRAEWKDLERADRDSLVRERRGVRGVAEPRGTLARANFGYGHGHSRSISHEGGNGHEGFGLPLQTEELLSPLPPVTMRRASIGLPEATPRAAPLSRERRKSVPAGFSFGTLLANSGGSPLSPIVADSRDALTLLGLPVEHQSLAPLHTVPSLGRKSLIDKDKSDPAKEAAKMFREARHRAQDLARGLEGRAMEVDSMDDGGNNAMSVEFEKRAMEQVC